MVIEVKGIEHSYKVHIENGLLNNLPLNKSKPTLLLSDDGVPKTYIKTVQHTLNPETTHIVASGERAKSLANYEDLVRSMEKNELGRDCRIIALGGGVINDLGGFVAATYKRGVELVLIPTTLLAMADASIGGKFALNTNASKNTIGTFYTPSHVFIDPETLDSLPQKHLANGMAEILKIALVRDAKLYEKLCHGVSFKDASIIHKAITLKKALVEKDPRDQNNRALLNFGHTFGHAIETVTSYEHLHGYCIAAGMKIMAKGKSYEKSLHDVLELYGLNKYIRFNREEVLQQVRFDKKRSGGQMTIVEVKTPGNGFLKRIDLNDLSEYLQ